MLEVLQKLKQENAANFRKIKHNNLIKSKKEDDRKKKDEEKKKLEKDLDEKNALIFDKKIELEKQVTKFNDKELLKELEEEQGNLKKEANKHQRTITNHESTIKDY